MSLVRFNGLTEKLNLPQMIREMSRRSSMIVVCACPHCSIISIPFWISVTSTSDVWRSTLSTLAHPRIPVSLHHSCEFTKNVLGKFLRCPQFVRHGHQELIFDLVQTLCFFVSRFAETQSFFEL